jgi:hypothetical protein
LGSIEFLVGQNTPQPSSLPQAIADLEDTSTLFVARWNSNDFNRAAQVSKTAMALLDFIVNEFLREKTGRKGNGSYTGTTFEREMSFIIGNGVTDVTLADQVAMADAGPGYGRLPLNVGSPVDLSLERLLNKVKHRNKSLMNFRIANGRHIFVVCPEHTSGGAEGISEFDVQDFCKQCKAAASEL